MDLLDSAFAHPKGFAGRICAMIMGRATKQRNLWTISLLDLHPDERILEVGFGPGALIHAMATQAPGAFVAGIDASPLMVRQATRRNKKHIESNHVSLLEGSALVLPFEEGSFDLTLSGRNKTYRVSEYRFYNI
ncbi:class I SAM-dependent methyltransferase [Dictyobacter kobayashii]|uniref:Methyltransferase domain-containing protein n=1 Tax=Dictyobacter kobayashii TaxID=2014872 RepID=A0A402AP05_9CHLR|nr:class I SAM-dependent methyltransferase [Dictyobacter kobayashii]GCE20765.1 hypothetical protein KDK_45650 [Dictyobacter kobayashii]